MDDLGGSVAVYLVVVVVAVLTPLAIESNLITHTQHSNNTNQQWEKKVYAKAATNGAKRPQHPLQWFVPPTVQIPTILNWVL